MVTFSCMWFISRNRTSRIFFQFCRLEWVHSYGFIFGKRDKKRKWSNDILIKRSRNMSLLDKLLQDPSVSEAPPLYSALLWWRWLFHLITRSARGGRREQLAIKRVIEHHLCDLWYSFHHLDENLYLVEIEEDVTSLKDISFRRCDYFMWTIKNPWSIQYSNRRSEGGAQAKFVRKFILHPKLSSVRGESLSRSAYLSIHDQSFSDSGVV